MIEKIGEKNLILLTCCLETSHESEPEDDEEAAHESGHPDLLQLFPFQNLEEGDVQKGPAGETLQDADDQNLRG